MFMILLAAMAWALGCGVAGYQPFIPAATVLWSLVTLAACLSLARIVLPKLLDTARTGLCYRASRYLSTGLCYRASRYLSTGLCYRASRYLSTGLLIIAVMLFGYCYASFQQQDFWLQKPSILQSAGAEGVICESELLIMSWAKRFAYGQSADVLLTPQCEALRSSNGRSIKIRLSEFGEHDELRPGDQFRAVVRLRAIHGNQNPGGFDFERYAAQNRFVATGQILRRIEQPTATHLLEISWPTQMQIALLQQRLAISDAIAAKLPNDRNTALIQALAVGDTRQLEEADWTLLRQAGITHLVAISGLHITLLASFGALLAVLVCKCWPRLTYLWPRPVWAAWVALIFATLYAALAGFEAPAQRTLIMLAALLAGVVLRRLVTTWQSYGLALGLVLLVDPFAVLDVGALLSFAAVGLLIVVFDLRQPKLSTLRLFFSTQVLMTIGLLPLSLLLFQQASIPALLINLLAIPWISLVLVPVVLACVVLQLLGLAQLTSPLLQLAAWLWRVLLELIEPLTRVGQYSTPSPSLLAVSMALIAALLCFAPKTLRVRYLAPLLILPLLLGAPEVRPALGLARIHVFDVGQGTAILLQTASQNWLVDTGPGDEMQNGGTGIAAQRASAAIRYVIPSLHNLGVKQMHGIILSHGDADHAGGIVSILSNFPAERFLTSDLQQFPDAQPCVAGQRWQVDQVWFEFLHPNPGLPYLRNESSCVLKITTADGASMLLPGDIGEVIEARLLRTQPDKLAADVLIAPHHGSAKSSTGEFLEQVRPRAVIYTTGFANRFQFPRTEVLERASRVGANNINVAERGTLRVELGGPERYQLHAQRDQYQRGERFWYH